MKEFSAKYLRELTKQDLCNYVNDCKTYLIDEAKSGKTSTRLYFDFEDFEGKNFYYDDVIDELKKCDLHFGIVVTDDYNDCYYVDVDWKDVN